MTTPLSDAAKAASLTYKQADYWCRSGYIHPAWRTKTNPPLPIDQGGSGTLRELTDLEVQVLVTMARLVRAGLCPATAAIVARSYVEDPTRPLVLAPGIRLFVNDRHPQDQP